MINKKSGAGLGTGGGRRSEVCKCRDPQVTGRGTRGGRADHDKELGSTERRIGVMGCQKQM